METVQQSITHLLGLNILSDITETVDTTEIKNTQSNMKIRQKEVFTKQPTGKSYYQKPIFIKDNNITEEENVDKIIIDSRSYPCPCSDCGGIDISACCLLDARIGELQNKFNNVKTYFNQKSKQYIITIPTPIKVPYNQKNKSRSKNKSRKKNKVIFKIGDSKIND
tara:strand:- start:100 stop:597 length:498 start_codon:yes stop_codon:yes gene_type:complete